MSFILIILVMLSSTSFIIKKHECPKMAQHKMVKQLKDCCTNQTKCCTSTIVFEKDASIDFISTNISFNFDQELCIQNSIFFIDFDQLFSEIKNKKKANYINFYPPDLFQKAYILYETFLI